MAKKRKRTTTRKKKTTKPYCVVRIGRGASSFVTEHCSTTRRAAEKARDRIAFKRAQTYGAQGVKFVVVRNKPQSHR